MPLRRRGAQVENMKLKRWCKIAMLMAAGAVALPGSARAGGDFTQTMTAEEAAATGLSKLSPEELARLKAVVERYKTGEVAQVQVQAEAKVTAVTQEAQQKVAVAEAKVREIETKVSAAPAEEKKGPGWLRALVTLKRAQDNPETAEKLETSIAGKFTGWEGRSIFHLENGQRWQVANGGSYVSPTVDSPKVKIYPAKLGGFWMKIEGVNSPVKVLPIDPGK